MNISVFYSGNSLVKHCLEVLSDSDLQIQAVSTEPLLNSDSMAGAEVDSFLRNGIKRSEQFLFVLDGSFDCLLPRALAKAVGGVHWYFDYFVKPYPNLQRITHSQRREALSCSDFFQEVKRSKCALFTQSRALQAAAASGGSLLKLLPIPLAECSRKRQSSSSSKALQIVLCAPPAVEYRVLSLFRVLSRVRGSISVHWMLDTMEVEQASRMLADFTFENVSLYAGRTPEQWISILQQANAAIHLSQSPYDELEQYLDYSLSCAVPVICSKADDRCLDALTVVQGGRSEEPGIRKFLEDVSAAAKGIESKISLGQEYVRQAHDPKMVAQDLLACLQEHPSDISSLDKPEVRASLEEAVREYRLLAN